LEKKIVYFEKAGKINTEETLRLAKIRAQELGIKNIVLASTNGYTAEKALEILDDVQLIVGGIERESFDKDLLKKLEGIGVPIFFSEEVDYTYPEMRQNAFKKLSEGVKVCMDICMMAAEKGVVPEGEEVVAIGGTGTLGFKEGGGADTALVMIPRTSEQFNILPEKAERRDVKEIICKPR
jgi:hypothetical protein